MKNSLVAVLEIGSTGIRLIVAEIISENEWRVLDRAVRPVMLGRDVFTSGELSRESLSECLAVLHNYRELLTGWNVADSDIHVIATSALREARNRNIFIDRVWQKTGFRLAIVDGVEENRLIYLAVRAALKQDFPLFWRGNSMVINIGGGSTEIMLLRRGQMVAARSLKLGVIIIDRRTRSGGGADLSARENALNEIIKNTMAVLKSEMDLGHVKTLVAVGWSAQLVSAYIGKELNKNCRIIEREDFVKFAEKIRYYTAEECVQKLQISYADAEGIISGVLVHKIFLEHTDSAQMVVPQVSIREGFLVDLSLGSSAGLQEEYFSQIIASALSLGNKFRFDETHARHVAQLCMSLFDALEKEHGLSARHRLLLETAAILHDIGVFIKYSGHTKHGQYIVANSEIFGLHRDELNVIANAIRYHNGPVPSEAEIEYMAMLGIDQLLVLKMAAILRVAEALDWGHSQRIRNIKVELLPQSIVIHADKTYAASVEQIELEKKSELFLDIFGYKIILS